MTGRDLCWRCAGLLLTAAGVGMGVMLPDDATVLGLAGFAAMAVGVLLATQGHHVPLAFRIEFSRHRRLPERLRSRRRMRRG